MKPLKFGIVHQAGINIPNKNQNTAHQDSYHWIKEFIPMGKLWEMSNTPMFIPLKAGELEEVHISLLAGAYGEGVGSLANAFLMHPKKCGQS